MDLWSAARNDLGLTRQEFLAMTPRELDGLFKHYYKGEALRFGCVRADIYNAAAIIVGSEQRFTAHDFVQGGTRETWEYGGMPEPDEHTLAAFKAALASKVKIKHPPGTVYQERA